MENTFIIIFKSEFKEFKKSFKSLSTGFGAKIISIDRRYTRDLCMVEMTTYNAAFYWHMARFMEHHRQLHNQ